MRRHASAVPPPSIYRATGDEGLDALGTWIWDLTQNSLTCSEEIARLAGVRPGELDGDVRSLVAQFVPDGHAEFSTTLARAVNEGAPFLAWLELQRADGKRVHVRVCGRPFHDTHGQPLWVVGTLSQGGMDSDQGTRLAGPADETRRWVEPRDRASAIAAYRRVHDLLPASGRLTLRPL